MNVFLIQLTNCESENDFEYKEDASRIAGMLNCINLNYRDVDLNILSDKFGYNSKYISRFFKKLTGVSFKDYIFKKKLNSFCNTLFNSDMPVRDILLQENISSESYFFNRFKEIYGCSPAEYRKLH
ncbi:MAG: helix-turn-helix transcriptional regulator [Erysipelotrichaceae bacterium]|nr:helix-turn-helix transcriptional regulator [Erysipelotrichaceae bacterium]